ncbi:hypothetical protein GCM10007877_36370 [Marinibactrum halimedae]|uniref:Type II secretion system protein H n=2 Tax=Marinibactrum halimedae TaxID=1444977 RepID=A0AA37WNZ0_9GAMM|nr:hypothetical protein GCM10007877_36370 [Marinibactrum halimedae]
MAIAGILLAIGVPSFTQLIRNNELTSVTNQIQGALTFARSEAIKQGQPIMFGARQGNWANGVVVWEDGDDDEQWDVGEELRLWEPLPETLDVTGSVSVTEFTFTALGEVDTAIVLDVCDDRVGENGSQVTLLVSGVSAASDFVCP